MTEQLIIDTTASQTYQPPPTPTRDALPVVWRTVLWLGAGDLMTRTHQKKREEAATHASADRQPRIMAVSSQEAVATMIIMVFPDPWIHLVWEEQVLNLVQPS